MEKIFIKCMEEIMEYIAHKNNGTTQSVKEHLENTARLAESFAIEPMKEMAYLEGLIHDLGKYSYAFQDHIMQFLSFY